VKAVERSREECFVPECCRETRTGVIKYSWSGPKTNHKCIKRVELLFVLRFLTVEINTPEFFVFLQSH